MNNYESIYDNMQTGRKTIIPKEIETMYYEQYGQSPKKKMFKKLRRHN